MSYSTPNFRKQKCYVIYEGGKPGIYMSWAECVRALGNPKGKPKYKSFTNLDEAAMSYSKYQESLTAAALPEAANSRTITPVIDLNNPARFNQAPPDEDSSDMCLIRTGRNTPISGPIPLPRLSGLPSRPNRPNLPSNAAVPKPVSVKKAASTTGFSKKIKTEKWSFGQQYPSLVVDAACTNPCGGVVEFRCVRICENKTVVPVFSYGPFQGGSNNIGEYLALAMAVQWLIFGHYDSTNNPIDKIYSDSTTAIKWVTSGCGSRTTLDAELICPELRAELAIWDRIVTNPDFTVFAQKVCRKWITSEWGEIPADYDRK